MTIPDFRAQNGVTLIELMVVAGIVALLAAIAYPSYDRYVVRSKRAVAQNALLQIADRQQQFFMDNKRYAADVTWQGNGCRRCTSRLLDHIE